jgi:hypothetical protein
MKIFIFILLSGKEHVCRYGIVCSEVTRSCRRWQALSVPFAHKETKTSPESPPKTGPALTIDRPAPLRFVLRFAGGGVNLAEEAGFVFSSLSIAES